MYREKQVFFIDLFILVLFILREFLKKFILFLELINIYVARLSGCLFVLFNKCQNGWNDRAQLLCGTSHDPGAKVYGTSKLEKKILKNRWYFFEKCANSKFVEKRKRRKREAKCPISLLYYITDWTMALLHLLCYGACDNSLYIYNYK